MPKRLTQIDVTRQAEHYCRLMLATAGLRDALRISAALRKLLKTETQSRSAKPKNSEVR